MRVAVLGQVELAQGSISSLAPSRFPRCRRCALRADLGRDRWRVRQLRVFPEAAGAFVAAAHVHPAQTERFEIAQGSIAFKLDGETSRPARATASSRRAPAPAHQWWNAGDGRLASRCEIRPALQFEQLIETMFSLAADGKTNEAACRTRCASPSSRGRTSTRWGCRSRQRGCSRLGPRARRPDRPAPRLPRDLRVPGRAARGRGRSGMTSPAMSSFARRCIARVAESEGRCCANAFARRRPRRVDPRAGHARGVPRRRADGGRGLGCVRHDRNAVDSRG